MFCRAYPDGQKHCSVWLTIAQPCEHPWLVGQTTRTEETMNKLINNKIGAKATIGNYIYSHLNYFKCMFSGRSRNFKRGVPIVCNFESLLIFINNYIILASIIIFKYNQSSPNINRSFILD